jgi:hypothetical protein
MLQNKFTAFRTKTDKPSYGPEPLNFHAAHASITGHPLTNNGHSLQVDASMGTVQIYVDTVKEADKVVEKTQTYEAMQLHFHSPSEHTLDGVVFGAEMQIVMTKKADAAGHAAPSHRRLSSAAAATPTAGPSDTMVVSVLFKTTEGSDNLFLESLGWKGAATGHGQLPTAGHAYNHTRRRLAASGSHSAGGDIDLGASFGHILTGTFDAYAGSLTTPPCSEGVQWIVMRGTDTISAKQVKAFKSLFPDGNARPTQARDREGRTWVREGKVFPIVVKSGCLESGQPTPHVHSFVR